MIHSTATHNVPLFEKLRKSLKNSIANGELRPAERLPAQVKLAKQFGVSQITVRRAIQELINEGLLVAHSGSGTYVASSDQAHLNPSVSKPIAVIFEDIVGGYPLVKPLFAAIREKCREADYTLQFVEMSGFQEDTAGAGKIPELDVAGAILTSPLNISMLARIVERGIPHVLLHNDVADGVSYSVSCNYASGIMQAALHLIEQDCRNILLVTAEEERYSAGQMQLGFELALRSRPGIQCSHETLHASYEEESTYEIIRRLITDNKLPDGLIFASDTMARTAVNALLHARVEIPREVAIVGFGDILKPYDAPVEISAVNAHNEKTGRAAMEQLQKLMLGQKPDNRRILIEPELVVRASSLRK